MGARRSQITMFVLAALLAAPTAARADYRFDGHGFGHGVGLAQWGAMGYARETRHSYRWILSRYYPGTMRANAPSARLRVRLKETTAARVAGAAVAAGAGGRRVSINQKHTYRFVPWEQDGLRMIDVATGHTRAHLHAPVRLTAAGALRVLGLAENGVSSGRYRGAIVLLRLIDRVLVVDDVGLEGYLYGVVPAEMPSAWPTQALRSQAVVARSYALSSRRAAEPFDVYADTRSQVYRGANSETTATTDAVRATRAVVLTAGGAIARTLFHSSSGGRTAAVEEVFGGPPIAYLRSVDDPYDRLAPYHDWTLTLTQAEAQRRLATLVAGDLASIEVTARTPSGRAETVRVTGTLGASDIPAATARALLGLRSTWFEVTVTKR